MGQYWMVVNLDKREFVCPHKLGAGLKLREQLAAHPGTGAALLILCAAQREKRGGGDFYLRENWHGPERKFPEHNTTPGPMPDGLSAEGVAEPYPTLAARTIGRWAGDRIALVGDYAEDADLAPEHNASTIYEKCSEETEIVWSRKKAGALFQDATGGPHHGMYAHSRVVRPAEFRDVSDDVAAVIEHELHGRFAGDGWREWKQAERAL